MPASDWIGSTMNAAKRLLARFFSRASTSSNGMASLSGSRGPKPSRQNDSPISDNAPQVSPWNAPFAYRRPARPVCARENLMAASTPSLPELAKKTFVSRPPARWHNFSPNSPARSATCVWIIAGPQLSNSSRIAAITAGWLCPTLCTP